MRPFGRDEGGSSPLEFAMLTPLFLMMLVGQVEVSRASWHLYALQYAVDDAARRAVVLELQDTAAIARLATDSAGQLSDVRPQVAVTVTAASITVSATYDFQFLVPELLPFGPLHFSAKSVFPRPL